PGKDPCHVRLPEMTADEFAEDVAIVGRHGEIAAFKKLLFFEAGPFSVNLPALDGAPDDHHEAAMTVIGSTVAVFLDGAAEFGHRDENNIFHSIAHSLAERGNTIRELAQKCRELHRLVPVVIPTSNIGKSHFDARVGFDQTRELLQIASELSRLTIFRNAGKSGRAGRRWRCVLWGILDGLDDLHRFEGILAGPADRCV